MGLAPVWYSSALNRYAWCDDRRWTALGGDLSIDIHFKEALN
jgi:hypothetical protein